MVNGKLDESNPEFSCLEWQEVWQNVALPSAGRALILCASPNVLPSVVTSRLSGWETAVVDDGVLSPDYDSSFDVVIGWSPGFSRALDPLFSDPARFLKPGGILLLNTPIVPGSRLRGKKAARQRQAGDYLNTMLRFHRRENGRCLSQAQWQDALIQAGIHPKWEQICVVTYEFHAWAAQAGQLSPPDRLRLQALLVQAPTVVLEFLTLQIVGDRIPFRWKQLVFIGKLGTGD